MSTLRSTSSLAASEGLQVVGAIGMGMLFVAPQFAILAPQQVKDNAHAVALKSYLRTFGQCVSRIRYKTNGLELIL